jgi:hypothetical protein
MGFSGAATVEQDPDPRVSNYSGLSAASKSMEFLRAAGLASDGGGNRAQATDIAAAPPSSTKE